MAYSLNDFILPDPRILPVIIAVDKSGSMQTNGKIDALNLALKEFVSSISNEDSGRVVIQVAIYSFGTDVSCDVPLQDVTKVNVPQYTASGRTPMGEAFVKIKELIEDKTKIPSRSYKPTIVLLTDGDPTDDIQHPLFNLVSEGRSAKAFRIAMGIGEDANKEMLRMFVSEPSYLVSGDNARDIRKFFRYVTMTVTQRTRSSNPDVIETPVSMPGDDVLDYG